MKCPHCGAEIENAKFCEYCGSQITAEMQREQEQLNKKGCPKCGSSNIAFRRENQGELNGKKSKQIIHRTVGVCKDCGETWFADNEEKKRKTWLWVLGWIFIFPVPLTILLLRKKDMNKILKYIIIAVAWIMYLAIGFSGGGESNKTTGQPNEASPADAVASTVETTNSSAEEGITIINGEIGEYGKRRKTDAGTELERDVIEYHIPVGKYKVQNKDKSSTVQISIYSDEWIKNSDGWEEPAETFGRPIVIAPGEEKTIEVLNESYVKISEGREELLFTRIN